MLDGEAVFDETRRYRYWLAREWLYGDGICVFVMLNPSTADEHALDPTVRRCVGYAKRWGFKRLEVLNLFAWRSTDPRVLPTLDDPVGPENLNWIAEVTSRAETKLVVCAWGKDGAIRGQGDRVKDELKTIGVEAWCLGLNGDGSPVHPLYQPNTAQLVRFV